MQYSIIKSNRKSISIQIDKNANIIVRAPKSLRQKQILSFVESKSTWITKKQKLVKNVLRNKCQFKDTDKVLYLGINYPIKITTSSEKISFNGEFFTLAKNCQNPDKIFKNWYKEQFQKTIIPRVHYLANKNNLKFNNIRLKAQKTIWGSCSAKNNINLNYLLMMAPIEVIDYVIVHELSHIIHKNHSQNFWNLVATIMPNYKKAKKWLTENGAKILLLA